MTKDEALNLALAALEDNFDIWTAKTKAITAIKEALAQPEQPKYRRGSRVICLETEDYCVIHISGTDRQWVKFPDSHIGVYTNEQVAELFELLPKEPEQEPVALYVYKPTLPRGHLKNVSDGDLPWVYDQDPSSGYSARMLVYTAPPQRTWVGLTDKEMQALWDRYAHMEMMRAIEAKLKEKNFD